MNLKGSICRLYKIECLRGACVCPYGSLHSRKEMIAHGFQKDKKIFKKKQI